MISPVDRIIDAHHHLWQLDAVNYPWLMQKGVRRFFGDPAPIQKNYLVQDFEKDIGSLPVVSSVHIQVGAATNESVAETAWLQNCADTQGRPGAIVAFADLSDENIDDVLDAHQTFGGVRGIRQIVGREAKEDEQTDSGSLMSDATWIRNLGRLQERQLSFDLQLIPQQLPAITQILQRYPDLKVALCHAGSPWDQTPNGMAVWKSDVQALSRLPNVHCKLSGFGMFDKNWTTESIKPICDHVLECFGASRTMFGSNFPVDKLYRDYQALYDSYFELSLALSREERADVFFNTAADFYRLKI